MLKTLFPKAGMRCFSDTETSAPPYMAQTVDFKKSGLVDHLVDVFESYVSVRTATESLKKGSNTFSQNK